MKKAIGLTLIVLIMVACSSSPPSTLIIEDNSVPETKPSSPSVSPPLDSGVSVDAAAPTCQAESDLQFCNRFKRQCGGFYQLDNCKELRVAECGNCETNVSTCDNGVCKKIPKACLPESDVAFCARNGYNCGTHTTTDNCGKDRTVSSCGSIRCLGTSSIEISGGAPKEIAGAGQPLHLEAWLKPQEGYSQSNWNSNVLSLSYHFGLTVRDGMIYLNIRGYTYGGLSILEGTKNYWTFIFAGYANNSYYLGKIVNDVITRIIINDVPAPVYVWETIKSGDYATIANGFVGQMNNVRIWSIARTNEDILPTHHDCLSGKPTGLVRQWCMLEGTGNTIQDSITKLPSVLTGAVWNTGSCF